MKFTIIGFDPASTKNIGWAKLTLDKKTTIEKIASWKGGTFVMSPVKERWQVLWPMFQVIDAFLEEANPDLVLMEQTSSFTGGFVTGQVSHCMGTILAACGKNNANVEFCYPSSVKKIVAGHGRSKKPAMKKAAKQHLENWGIKNVKFDSEHTADATANILYWLIKNGINSPFGKEE